MMEVIAKIVSAAMVSVFVQNAIFDRAFGSNVGIYASRKNSTVIGFTLGITAMTTLASIVSFFVDQAMLPTEFGWLFMPLIYSAVISVLYDSGASGAVGGFFQKYSGKYASTSTLRYSTAPLSARFSSTPTTAATSGRTSDTVSAPA